jgi:hypothetical protein
MWSARRNGSAIVDELVVRFTHSCRMDYFCPVIAPAHRRVELPLVGSVQESQHVQILRAGRILAYEHVRPL